MCHNKTGYPTDNQAFLKNNPDFEPYELPLKGIEHRVKGEPAYMPFKLFRFFKRVQIKNSERHL